MQKSKYKIAIKNSKIKGSGETHEPAAAYIYCWSLKNGQTN